MQNLLIAMQKSRVSNVIIFGMPVIKKWDQKDEIQPQYYLDNDAKSYYYSLTDEIIAQAILQLPLNI